MSTVSTPSDDGAGARWHRLFDPGAEATLPCVVDFWHIFPKREQALHFAALTDDRELEISISYYRARAMWQTVVKRLMVPSQQDIATLEHLLAMRAHSVGGQADGWDNTHVNPPNA